MEPEIPFILSVIGDIMAKSEQINKTGCEGNLTKRKRCLKIEIC